jgi:hypothetical protein
MGSNLNSKYWNKTGQWLMLVTLGTQEVEARRIEVEGQSGQKGRETPSQPTG